jgi:membrane protein required for colicin V production
MLLAQDFSLGSITILDLIFVGVLVYSSLRGFTRGVISELGMLIGLIVGLVLASQFAAEVGAPLGAFGFKAPIRAAGGYAAIMILVWIVARVVTGIMRGGAKILMLGLVDRVAGTAFGFLRGLLAVVVIAFLVVHFRVEPLDTLAQGSPITHLASFAFPALNALLPLRLQHGPLTA